MLRRSFRIGLTLGILAGVGVAVVKTLQSRREAPTARPGPARPPAPEPPSTVVRQPVRTPPDVPHRGEDGERERVAPGPDGARDTGVVGRPVHPPPDVPHDEEAPAGAPPAPSTGPQPPPPAPVPKAARPAKQAAKQTRKAARKTASRAKKATTKASGGQLWVEPTGDTCPPSHPMKAKLSSRIFHAPGQLNYERTSPDRCYRDEQAAQADGLRQAKR